MKILFLTYYFPPDPAVGSIRAGNIRDAWLRAGHQVTVVTRQLTGGAPPEPGVHRVTTLPNPREIAMSLRDRARRVRRKRTSPNPASGGYRPPEHVPSWKRFLVAMALMPDDYHGFILPAVSRSLPVLLRGIDLIYTSGPPHSVHLAGLTIATLTGLPWVAEFRDPWTDNAIQPRYGRSASADRMRMWLEKRCMKRADAIVAVAEAAGAILARKTAAPVIVARNGIPGSFLTDRAPAGSRSSGPRRILYLGNLYHARDPRPLLRALGALRSRGCLPAEGVRVEFYGECAWYDGTSVRDAAAASGVDDLVHVHDRVPLEQARKLTLDSDLLLLLAQNQPLQVPQKLYEYIAAGRPILAFTDQDSETAAILRMIGEHHVVYGNDADGAERALASALHCRNAQPTAPEVLSDLSAEHQMDRLVSTLSQSFQRSKHGS